MCMRACLKIDLAWLACLALATAAHADPVCRGVFAGVQVNARALAVEQAPVIEAPMVDLSSRATPHAMTLANARARVLGTTTATRASAFEYRYRMARLPDGSVCVQPKVEITLAYQPLLVEVASELRLSHCLREEVLAHEQQHVQAYRAHLERAARQLSTDLPAVLGDVSFHAASFDEASTAIDQALDARVEVAIQSALDQVSVVHAGIDTPEESARMYTVCQGALGMLWP